MQILLETSMEQVGGCKVAVQKLTHDAKEAQETLEFLINNLCHGNDIPHHNREEKRNLSK